jgi:transcriptional regulator with XRE-family HTH domain
MTTDLGDYLRARRADIRPQDLGFPVGGRRQVAGLRREEVAVAAGMSVDYYVRLEQGRETNPSPQVLDSLGRVLALDDDGRLHLFRLAGLSPSPASVSTERAATELLVLLDSWPRHPALVLGRAYDVLAANTLGHALFAHSPYRDNVARMVFLDPAARSLYVDWSSAAAATVAGLRLADGAAPSEPRLRAVIQELRETSPEFEQLWSTTDARSKRPLNKQFLHPQVGPLTLRAHSFDVRDAPGQELVVYQAEPGSPSADALGLLSTIAATLVATPGR